MGTASVHCVRMLLGGEQYAVGTWCAWAIHVGELR
jgi:hypothetical protein